MAGQAEKVFVGLGNDLQDGIKTLEWTLRKWNSHQISVVILHLPFNTPMDFVYTPCKLIHAHTEIPNFPILEWKI